MAAIPVTINLCRARGDTFRDIFNIKDSNGNAVDVTGATFLLTVDPEEEPATSSNNLFQLNGTIEDAINGAVSFKPSAVQADQAPDVFFYDLQMTDSNGDIRTIAKGEYEFLQDITK